MNLIAGIGHRKWTVGAPGGIRMAMVTAVTLLSGGEWATPSGLEKHSNGADASIERSDELADNLPGT